MTILDDEKLLIPEPKNGYYDVTERMVHREIASPGYHTNIRYGMVHPTRESLAYAAKLFATQAPPAIERGMDIVDRVIALQDQDETSNTWGIWSWYLEEPLEKMSPPDWNWADFCATSLLEIRTQHACELDAALASRIDDAIRHAAGSIRRRNVNLDYTNIAVLGTYVTLHAAQHLEWAEMHDYAMDRLRRFDAFTRHHGAFTEYNSPTYTLVVLTELGRLRQIAPAGEARDIAERLYRMAWEEIAHHFHAPTRQWAGPHSRCYETLLSASTLSLIERASDGRISFSPGTEGGSFRAKLENRVPLPLPCDLDHYFESLETPRQLVKTFERGEHDIVGTTYLHPRYAIGTINTGNMWAQHRPLVAYWGSSQRTSYMRLRFLRDLHDLHAATFFGRQSEGQVLAGIVIATDQGISHPFFDRMSDASFEASDIRLRFEFGGEASRIRLPQPGAPLEPVHIEHQGVHMRLAVLLAQFGDWGGTWHVSRDDQAAYLDLVFYTGPRRAVALRTLKRAVIGLSAQIADATNHFTQASANASGDYIHLTNTRDQLIIPGRPDTLSNLRKMAFEPLP
jgi:hypothetical protein